MLTVLENTEPNITVTNLASHVTKLWELAVREKSNAHQAMIDSLDQYNARYSPAKLAEIRKMGGSEVFVALTTTKCNAAISWLQDILFQPNSRPWDVEPTPIPELPPEIESQITQQTIEECVMILQQNAMLAGQQDVAQLIMDHKHHISKRVIRKLKERSKEILEEAKLKIDDQLWEGGWYHALKTCLFDLVVLKLATIKGPVYRKVKRFNRTLNRMTGQYENSVTEEIMPTFERVSPFNIYPLPGVTDIRKGGVFEKMTLTRSDLYDLIGVEGFNEDAIRAVLSEFATGGLKDWTSFDSSATRAKTDNMANETMQTEDIDCLAFWGSISGKLLIEYGVEEVDDPERDYQVCLWKIGRHVIKAMLNPDPLGETIYSSAGYSDLPDSFWKKNLPELISDLQQICNATARAICNNSAMASGPMVEVDIARVTVEQGQPFIYPWKVIESTDTMMSGSNAVKFYQPQVIVEQLMSVFDYYSKLADQYSVPSFAHGDTNIGGAGNTASGLSQLMGAANRIIKSVLANLDTMIESSITRLYRYNITYEPDMSKIGDLSIAAKGSAALMEREQKMVRRNEFLAATNNPLDAQIMGLEGRRELLYESAKTHNFDNLERILPEKDVFDEMMQQNTQMMMQQQLNNTPPAKAKTLDQAGNAAAGQDNRLIKQDEAPQMRANLGGGE